MHDRLCECGCGQPTLPYTHTVTSRGQLKGQPARFVRSHHLRRNGHGLHWKGGRTIDDDGYVSVWQPDHPRARGSGYVYEHILVAERVLGRFVDAETERVHHVNHIRDDNRPENLLVMSTKDHDRLHRGDRMAAWRDPEKRIKMLSATKTPQARAKQAASFRARWADPAFRQKMLSARSRHA